MAVDIASKMTGRLEDCVGSEYWEPEGELTLEPCSVDMDSRPLLTSL